MMRRIFKIAAIPCYLTGLYQGGISAAEKTNPFPERATLQHKLELEAEINREYVKVNIESNSKIQDPYRLITHTLPINVLPLLPTSYRWVKEGDEYVVMKHRSAPDHRLEFVVFADDVLSPTKVNYCTLIDDINAQSFAHTRGRGQTFNGKRDAYPFTVQEPLLSVTTRYPLRNQVKLIPYLDGHCIDHADTIYPERVNYHHSSKDIRNHIPEPNHSYWGLHVRNPLVASIRKEGGCYMQIPYYSANAPKTNLGAFVPRGIYFNKFSREANRDWVRISPQKTYHIPWSDDIHSRYQSKSWQALLNKKEVDDLIYGYFPNLSHLENQDLTWWEETIANLQNTSPVFTGQWQNYDHMIANNAKIVADWETESINYKLKYLYYSHLEDKNNPDIPYWHNRTLQHADLLDTFQMTPFNFSQLHEAQYVMKLADEDQQDHWRQIISNQEDFSKKETRSPTQFRGFGKGESSFEKSNSNDIKNMGRFTVAVDQEKDGQHDLANFNYNLAFEDQLSEKISNTKKGNKSSSIGKTPAQQNQDNFKVVQFHTGKGSLKSIGIPPENPETINRVGKILLKDVDAKKVKKWLEANKEPFRSLLNKAQIEIHYEPTTKGVDSWNNIENTLRNAGFMRLFRKTQ